jgi:hypothetical protein
VRSNGDDARSAAMHTWSHDGLARRSFLLKRLASIFPTCYIPPMEWLVEYTDAFGVWWDHLTAEEQEDLNAVVILLQTPRARAALSL